MDTSSYVFEWGLTIAVCMIALSIALCCVIGTYRFLLKKDKEKIK